MHAAVVAVDLEFTTAGAGAVYTGHPLERCFRDLHTPDQDRYDDGSVAVFSSATPLAVARNRSTNSCCECTRSFAKTAER